MSKRTERDNDCVDVLHPTKLTRRMSELRLAAADPDSLPTDGEMDGVEARDFVYLNKHDMLDALNGVEIDDRFMRIPASITANPKQVPYFERPTQALIPYQPDPDSGRAKEGTASDEANDIEDAMLED